MTEWSRYTTGAVTNPALARDKAGVLHVAWREGSAIKHAAIDKAGVPSGVASLIAGFGGAPADPVLVAKPDGSELRVLLTADGVLQGAISKDSGATWEALAAIASIAGAIAVAGDKDGNPLALSSEAGHLKLQQPPAAAETVYEGAACCGARLALALDAESAEGWAVWEERSTKLARLMAKAVKPSAGKAIAAPGATLDASSPWALAARRGAPGVYLAYAAGRGPARQVRLWNVRGGEAFTVARAPGAHQVRLASAPDGRLWVFWRNPNNTISAVRSDMSLLRFSAPYAIGNPGAGTSWQLAGDAARGPLDAIAGPFHARLYSRLTVDATPEGIRVSDVGDPVEGAKVEVDGKTLKTDDKGLAAHAIAAGATPAAKVTLEGYAPATLAPPAAAGRRAR